MTAMPAHTHALPLLPIRHIRTDGIDHTGHLMTRDTRIRETRPMSVLDERIAMADSASFNFDADSVRTGLREWTLAHLEWSTGTRYLHGRHL
jgi:hypothetical protein